MQAYGQPLAGRPVHSAALGNTADCTSPPPPVPVRLKVFQDISTLPKTSQKNNQKPLQVTAQAAHKKQPEFCT
jgi:hypothetical protein